jgi:hypothetical protein
MFMDRNSNQTIRTPFKESESSLMRSQYTATGPYPNPGDSHTHVYTPVFKMYINVIIAFTPRPHR